MTHYHVATLPGGRLAFRTSKTRRYRSTDGQAWSVAITTHPYTEIRLVDAAEFRRLQDAAPSANRKKIEAAEDRIRRNEWDRQQAAARLAAIDAGRLVVADDTEFKNDGHVYLRTTDKPEADDWRVQGWVKGSNIAEARAATECAKQDAERLIAKAQRDLAKLTA
jgi:hypothetical protein